jgi:hypothetical protein
VTVVKSQLTYWQAAGIHVGGDDSKPTKTRRLGFTNWQPTNVLVKLDVPPIQRIVPSPSSLIVLEATGRQKM